MHCNTNLNIHYMHTLHYMQHNYVAINEAILKKKQVSRFLVDLASTTIMSTCQ